MNLTNEQKARIFAQYKYVRTKGGDRLLWCGHTPDFENPVVHKPSTGPLWCNWDEIFIEAKPLAAITDEDAIEVAKIFGVDMNDAAKDEDGKKFIERDDEFEHICLNFWIKTSYEYDEWDVYPLTINQSGDVYDHRGCSSNQILIYQYLIQQGYAVPLFIAPNHPLNGKTAIELNLALDVTTLRHQATRLR